MIEPTSGAEFSRNATRLRSASILTVLAMGALVICGCSAAAIDRLLKPDSGAAQEPVVEAAAAPGFAPGQFPKLAIAIDDSSRRIDESSRRAVEDEFIRALLAKGYTVASRSDVDALLKEVKFQQKSGFTDKDAAKLGRALNVPAVLIVTIADVGTTSRDVRGFGESRSRRVSFTRASVGARLIDVERAEILWSGTSNGEYAVDRDYRNQVTGMVAKAVARAVPSRS